MSDDKIFEISPGEQIEDDRSRFTIFFQVLGRKFWKLINVNLMYAVFNIPAAIVAIILAAYIGQVIVPYEPNASAQADPLSVLFMTSFPIVMFLMAIPVISVGPAQAGLTYILRNFSYENPVFIWMDFKDKMKENIKQGFAVSIINILAIVFLLVDIYLYSLLRSNSSIIFPIANGLLIVAFVIFLMMCLYLYPMMVSYTLKLKDLYKNAFLFAFGRFLPNLLILVICFLLIVAPIIIVSLTASIMGLLILYIYYAILGFTLPGLIINFFINPIIDKYLRPRPAENSQQQG